LMPAEMLERSTPAAHGKGRVQEGADADIVVFDPQTVSDRSTYQHPMETSVGVRYLLVGGAVVVDQGKLVENAYPGHALTGPSKPWSSDKAGSSLFTPIATLEPFRIDARD